MTSDSGIVDDTLHAFHRISRMRIVALAAIAIVAGAALFAVYSVRSVQAAGAAQAAYRAQLARFDAAVTQARGQGYTTSDLSPLLVGRRAIQARQEPFWVGARPGFWEARATAVEALRAALPGREAAALTETLARVDRELAGARTAIDQNRQAGVDDATLAALGTRLDQLVAARGQTRAIGDAHGLDAQAGRLLADATAAGKAQAEENRIVEQAAQALIQQTGGDVNALRQIAQGTLGAARDDASVAAYLSFGHQFKGDVHQVEIAAQRLERYAPMADSAAVEDVARAAAAGRRYAAQMHAAYMAGAPSKFIVVSFQAQQLWAYENGGEVQTSLVTTGRPALPTDMGPMHVLSKNSPWKMVSPWPKESPFYYEPAWVQRAIWFTNTGEALHDAYWEPDDAFGPGSQYTGVSSHGCVHVLDGPETFLYGWADAGTPVVVYPGDGSPVASQVQRITTDDHGVPPNGRGFRGA